MIEYVKIKDEKDDQHDKGGIGGVMVITRVVPAASDHGRCCITSIWQ
jgi:hypothetical protein